MASTRWWTRQFALKRTDRKATTMEQDDRGQLYAEPLSNDAVIAILTNDLPLMTEAQLAELLANILFAGPNRVGDAIAPLARAELARRRFIAYVESVAAAE